MSDAVGIDFHGLDKDFQSLIDQFPEESEKYLREQAKAWKESCNDKGYKHTQKEKSQSRRSGRSRWRRTFFIMQRRYP